ncbi:MAG: TadE/TadG family type IV pilus assembly protein [Sphingomonas bacterium]
MASGPDIDRLVLPARTPGGRSLVRDQRGATIIEFAAVAAPFIALIIAALQTAVVFFTQQALETSAEQTARQLIVGSAQNSGMNQTSFRNTACANLPAFMDCNKLMIDVQNTTSFSAVNTVMPTLTYKPDGTVSNAWTFSPGGPGSIVIMRMMYQMPIVAGPLGFNLANMNGNRRLLVATSVFKAEPYDGGSGLGS